MPADDFLIQLRQAVNHYHESLRHENQRGVHRDPFLQWYNTTSPTIRSPQYRILLVLVNARFDQGGTAERALANTIAVYQSGVLDQNNPSVEDIPELKPRQRVTAEKWRTLFHRALPGLNQLAKVITDQQRWTAQHLTSRIIRDKIPYFGRKTAALAVRWLAELIPELDIDMMDSEVPIDTLIYRVTARLGIIQPAIDHYNGANSPAYTKIQAFAKTLFPENPSLLDEPLWMMGRQPKKGGYCYPKQPACNNGCLLNNLCPRNYLDHDPASIGYATKTAPRTPKIPHNTPQTPRLPRNITTTITQAPVPGLLVIVSCVKKKAWDRDPKAPPLPARDAYASTFFKKNRMYAETFGERWVILSAKHGFINPDELITNYDFSFKHHHHDQVTMAVLQQQLQEKGLEEYHSVQVLGGHEYVKQARTAFATTTATINAPLQGMSIGVALHCVQQAIDQRTAFSANPRDPSDDQDLQRWVQRQTAAAEEHEEQARRLELRLAQHRGAAVAINADLRLHRDIAGVIRNTIATLPSATPED